MKNVKVHLFIRNLDEQYADIDLQSMRLFETRDRRPPLRGPHLRNRVCARIARDYHLRPIGTASIAVTTMRTFPTLLYGKHAHHQVIVQRVCRQTIASDARGP